jgi:hypothetical protein
MSPNLNDWGVGQNLERDSRRPCDTAHSFDFSQSQAHRAASQPEPDPRVSPFGDAHVMTADETREARIEALYLRWYSAASDGQCFYAERLWREYIDAINERSPAQVARMERERGL